MWAKSGFLLRGKEPDIDRKTETVNRCKPLWIISGDFNFTPESAEYELLARRNFVDVIPNNAGTKAKGVGNDPTLTLDYILAGPKFISLDPIMTQLDKSNNRVALEVKCSDHYPLIGRIPMAFE